MLISRGGEQRAGPAHALPVISAGAGTAGGDRGGGRGAAGARRGGAGRCGAGMLSAALPGMLLSAAPGAMLAAVVALLVAVCVVLPSAPPLRHLLLRAALLRASGWQRRRLELQSTDVRHGQERRLRRLLPHGAAPGEPGGERGQRAAGAAGRPSEPRRPPAGSDAFRERHPPSPCCSDGERAEPLPPLSLWAVLRSCWSAEPALQVAKGCGE